MKDIEEVNSPWPRKEREFENPLIMDLRKEKNKAINVYPNVLPIEFGVNHATRRLLGKAPRSTEDVHKVRSNKIVDKKISYFNKVNHDLHTDKGSEINFNGKKYHTLDLLNSNSLLKSNQLPTNTPLMIFTTGAIDKGQPQSLFGNSSSLINVPVKDGPLIPNSVKTRTIWKRQKSKANVNKKCNKDFMNNASKKQLSNEHINIFSLKRGKNGETVHCSSAEVGPNQPRQSL